MGYVKYFVGALVALLFTLYTWLGAGTISPWLRPWALGLAALIAEMALIFPEQRHGESLFDARKRVLQGVIRDPLTWFSLGLFLFLTLQWWNAATFLEWHTSTQTWTAILPPCEWMAHPETETILATTPRLPAGTEVIAVVKPAYFSWLPWSLRSDEARIVLDWFVPIFVALLAIRHATSRRTQRYLMTFTCMMTSLLAIGGILDWSLGTQALCWGREAKAFFFATFGYPNHAACFFPAVMLMAVGLFVWSYEHRDRSRVPLMLYILTIGLCGIGGVLSGSRAGVIFVGLIICLCLVYLPWRLMASCSLQQRGIMIALMIAIIIGVFGTAAFRFYAIRINAERQEASQTPLYTPMPAIDPVINEIATTDWKAFFEDPMLVRSGYQGVLARRQHEEYFWYGAGARSFRRLSGNYIDKQNPEEADWSKMRMGIGQANVHNDTLQFLAEHGTLGFGLMVGCFLCLLIPFLKGLWQSPRQVESDIIADRNYFFRINAFYFFAFFAILLVLLHSFVDLVFRSPACLMLWGLFFVCAPGFAPRKNRTSQYSHNQKVIK